MPVPYHSISFFTGRMPFLVPKDSVKALKAYDINKQTIYVVPKSKIESRAHYTPEPAWGEVNS